MIAVHGTCAARFAEVREVLLRSLESGADIGAAVAVFQDGEPVVDIWGGVLDPTGTPWQADTLINVWSLTKTLTNLCAVVLADRGELNLHAPLRRYWPEFAAAGKGAIEVRHVLGHTAGLPGWDTPLTVEDLYDWGKVTDLLAAQAPWWVPGSASGYHAMTQGYLVGELVRRVTGLTLGEFLAAELVGPLGADFHIGLGAAHEHRVARVIPSDVKMGTDLPPNGMMVRVLGNPPIAAADSWEASSRRAEIPAANGHGTARSVAAVLSALACEGTAGGVRLLSPAGCARVFEEQSHSVDLVLQGKVRIGMGYGLSSIEAPLGPNPRICYWGGWGGSLAVIDLDAHLVVSYVMNRMGAGTLGDQRGRNVVAAAYRALSSAS